MRDMGFIIYKLIDIGNSSNSETIRKSWEWVLFFVESNIFLQ